jgi:hypothetical protein
MVRRIKKLLRQRNCRNNQVKKSVGILAAATATAATIFTAVITGCNDL